MVDAQGIERERVRQSTRIPDFETVGEEADFDGSVAVVVAVGNGVDNRFGHSIRREFVGGRRGDAGGTGADGAVDLGENEVARLIGLFEQVAAINLLGGKGALV